MSTELDTNRMSLVEAADAVKQVKHNISRVLVGQDAIVEDVLTVLFAGGHVLLEGVPGLGKTLLVRALAKSLNVDFSRVQFTPDLMPSDVVGHSLYDMKSGEFNIKKGPAFTNILLADEINRATPKTQSALLETMQEKTVTAAGQTRPLELPYFVLATQNPLEMDGTYPLPEAQLDRFFFKLNVEMPGHDDFAEILDRTTGITEPQVDAVADGPTILRMGHLARQVPIAPAIRDHLIKLVTGTHPERKESTAEVRKYIRYGASPRAAQAMLLAARIRALLDGRFHVSTEDVDASAIPALRHRLILSFEGQAEGMTADRLIKDIIAGLK